jgi:hypothetical protein
MILARKTSRCGLVPAPMICRSFLSRFIVIRTGRAAGPAIAVSSRVALITEECTRTGPTRGSRPGVSHTRGPATLAGMPVPSRRVKDITEGTVDHHASLTHPDLQEITIRWRGSFGYLAAWAGPGDDTDEEIRLCRIEYLSDDDWGFALYDPATEEYQTAVLRTGQPSGSAIDAYDTAAIVHLADHQE